MADSADESAAGGLRKGLKGGIAYLAIDAGHADLDQFVIVERPLGFGDNAGGHPRIADEDDGL